MYIRRVAGTFLLGALSPGRGKAAGAQS